MAGPGGLKIVMNLQRYARRKEQVIAQKASNDFLLFNMDDGNYYSLNEVGSRIWELCDGTHSIEQIIDALAQEYDEDKDVLAEDVVEFLERFQSDKLIVEVAQSEPSVVSHPTR
jgi:coenzyme PQQ biosynthesis protein PqqD